MPRYEFAVLLVIAGKATLTNYNTKVVENVFPANGHDKYAYLSINGWRIVHVEQRGDSNEVWLQRQIDWDGQS